MITFILKEIIYFLKSLIEVPFILCQNKRCLTNLFVQLYLKSKVKHLYGPKEGDINLTEEDAIVLCPVKNSEFIIKEFIEYHFSIGVKHIVFLDNMSNDKTIEIARSYDNVTILQTDASFLKFQKNLRTYLIKQFSKVGTWTLYLDADELFEIPFKDKISLKDFLHYLNRKKFTAVHSYMAEVFSNSTLNTIPNNTFKEFYNYLDISGHHMKIKDKKKIPKNIYHFYCGGIRNNYFKKPSPISKYPLFKTGNYITARDFEQTHSINNKSISVASVSAVILHYQFVYTLAQKTATAIVEKNYPKGSQRYVIFQKTLEKNNNPNLFECAEYPVKYSYQNLVSYSIINVSDDFYDYFSLKKPTNLLS